MILAAGLALALVTPAPPAEQRDALVARWTAAQQKTIASIHDPKRRAAAQQRFDGESRQLTQAPQSPPGVDVVALAKRELATRGRYQLAVGKNVAEVKPWWQRAIDWLGDRWNDLWKAVFGRAHMSQGTAQTVGTLLIAVFVLVLVLIAVRLFANVELERRKRAQSVEALDGLAGAQVLYARACRSAETGAYGDAAKLLFAATVAALDMRGDVRHRTSATVREMRGTLRARGGHSVANFDAIARPFVTSAYAEREVRSDEWEAACTAYAALVPDGAR